MLEGKTVLVTGGTGSFGKKFAEVCVNKGSLKSLRVFSRGELLQYEMRKEFKDDPLLRFLIGDVRDCKRVRRAMQGVDLVVHAAALKQVTTCEYNPIEAVETNIKGAVNIIDAAIDNGVDKVIFISSDKAVYPVNLYGATKMVAEKLFVQANTYRGKTGTRFSCVRYGNVVGSRGSVIPLFLEQRDSGELTITDRRMTRFWLTLSQGVEFVISCIDKMRGGEIFVPKIPSMKLLDLAEVIAPGKDLKVTGIRPGEKLHETLLVEEESLHCKEHETHFVIEPEHPFWIGKEGNGVTPTIREFEYTSSNNMWWLKPEELRAMVEEYLSEH